MKTKLLLSALLSFVFCLLSSQVPQGFNYQAIARNSNGVPITSQTIPVRISIVTSLTGGTVIWQEEHSSVTADQYGLISLVVGTGTRTGGSAASFSAIDWSSQTFFLKTEVKYPGPGWTDMGTSQIWSVPYSLQAKNVGPLSKLGIAGTTADMEEALFEVKNKSGQTVFAVYNEGIRAYVGNGDAKGKKGGFSVGGYDATKGSTIYDLLTLNTDSARIYFDSNPAGKGKKGGFSVGGYDMTKGGVQNYLDVNSDSVRIYVENTSTKGKRGGFAVGGYDATKNIKMMNLLTVSSDSVRIYVDNANAKGKKGGFAVGGYDMTKDASSEYLRVTSDSVKVSKSLLIPRLTTYERDNLAFVPGEALIIFNMTEGCMQIYKNNVWSNIWCFNCAPAFIIQPVDNTICSGNNVVFFVSATGTNLIYRWQESNDDGSTWSNISNGGSNPVYSGSNGSALTLSNVPVGYHSYKYRCIVAGSCLPDVISNAVTLNVGSTPHVITLQPSDQEISNECSASFSVVSPGYGVSYQWQLSADGGDTWSNISNGGTSPVYSGVTTTSLSLSNIPSANINNKYRCIISNLCGADVPSASVKLIVNAKPAISVQPVNKLVYSGQDVNFNITTSGSGFSYQWQESTDNGNTWSVLTNSGSNPSYSGTNTSTLSLSNVPVTYNNYKYRSALSHYCRPDVISDAATLSTATSSPITDIDGNTYNTIGIGSQLWMAENLKTTRYADGTFIPLVNTQTTWNALNETSKAYCWYNDNISNKDIYGALYTWAAAMNGADSSNTKPSGVQGVCPTGWHLPSDAEWIELETYLGGAENAGGKLKESGTTHWASPNAGATNETGFTALPGGARWISGGFNNINVIGAWWNSSEYDTGSGGYSGLRTMNKDQINIGRSSNFGEAGYSVRCLKN
jgi:Fibrobacter succinogenes major domain (Fib_succ_major).